MDIELAPYRFDPIRAVWLPYDPQPEAQPQPDLALAAATLPGQLTVVTYNVWFDPLEQKRRWQALLDDVARRDADVIAFQEVTRPFLAMLTGQRWVRDGYVLSDGHGQTFGRYGVVLLIRASLPIVRLFQHEMPSQMGRTLVVVDLASGFAVATIHLESLPPSRRYRDIQFAIAVDILDEFEHAILMGDMNFCSSWPKENARIPAHYTDLWPALHPDDPGYTEDTRINEMLHVYEQKHKQVRYDRVFLHSRDGSWQPAAIERLGTRPIADDPLLFPSDHFGLCARLTRMTAG